MTRKYETVLVTGASSGMGKDIASRLLEEGYTVYAAARSVGKMDDLAARGAIVLAMDITKNDQVEAAVNRILEERGGVDVLVNNAGYGQYGPVEDTPIDTARYQFEVNLFGLARLTQLLIPAMRDRNSRFFGSAEMANGTVRPEIVMHWCRSGDSASQGLLVYSTWKFKDVVVDSYSISASEDGIPEETWSLAYASLEHEYKSTNQKTGKLTTEGTFKWNVQTGKVEDASAAWVFPETTTTKASGSEWVSWPFCRSCSRFCIPLTRLSPRDSMIRSSTIGLVAAKLAGLSASAIA